MKSPARAKGPAKAMPAKPASDAARKPTKPTAKAKQVATPRRATVPAKKPAASPAKVPTQPAAAKAATPAKQPAAVAKAAPKATPAAAKKPATPAPKPAPTPPKAERGTTAGKVAAKPVPAAVKPAAAKLPASAGAAPAKASPSPKPAAPPVSAVAPAAGAGPAPLPAPAVVPASPVPAKVAPVPKSVAPKAAPVAKAPAAAAPIITPPTAAPVLTDRPVSEAVPPRPTHIPHKMGGAPMTTPRLAAKPTDFKAGDMVVYPTHGVGSVQGLETVNAAGYSLSVIVVTFEENRMTLRVPVNKAASSGLRKLASNEGMKEALDTLKGRARIKRTMWSRRAQEYEAKINSGDPVAIAEVVRDLHRNAGQPDQSFSERQIYEQAMDRLAAELAAIDRTDKAGATEKLLQHLKAG